MTGRSSTHEKCLETIGLLPNPVIEGPALTHDAVPTHNDDESSCRPVLQPLSTYGRFLFIKLARNETEPSAKAKRAEVCAKCGPPMTLGNMRTRRARAEPQFVGLPTFMNANN